MAKVMDDESGTAYRPLEIGPLVTGSAGGATS